MLVKCVKTHFRFLQWAESKTLVTLFDIKNKFATHLICWKTKWCSFIALKLNNYQFISQQHPTISEVLLSPLISDWFCSPSRYCCWPEGGGRLTKEQWKGEGRGRALIRVQGCGALLTRLGPLLQGSDSPCCSFVRKPAFSLVSLKPFSKFGLFCSIK